MTHNTDIADTWEREARAARTSIPSHHAATHRRQRRPVRDDPLMRGELPLGGWPRAPGGPRLCGAAAYAQRGSIWVNPGGFGGFRNYAPRWATDARTSTASFMYAAATTIGAPRGRRQGLADRLSRRRQQLPRPPRRADALRVKFDPTATTRLVVIQLADPLLYRCPMLFMEDIGTADFAGRKSRTCASTS